MKKILMGLGALLLLFVVYFVYVLFIATPKSPPGTAEYSDQGLEIAVNYSRPYKKGRLIFGEEADGALQPYGQYWRLGANAATEISLSKDVLFAGKSLNAGTYRMSAVPGPKAFKINLNSELDVFFGITEPDPEFNVLSVDAPVIPQTNETEMFTISFSNDSEVIMMNFVWDKTLFSVPITVQ